MRDELIPSKHDTYHIKIRGHLDLKWRDWFDGFSITHQTNDETLLIGTVEDQSALHGMLTKINNLGLSLLLVNRVEAETK